MCIQLGLLGYYCVREGKHNPSKKADVVDIAGDTITANTGVLTVQGKHNPSKKADAMGTAATSTTANAVASVGGSQDLIQGDIVVSVPMHVVA